VLDRQRDVIDDGIRPVFFRQPAQFDRRHWIPLNLSGMNTALSNVIPAEQSESRNP
jgi:hypothetical protein